MRRKGLCHEDNVSLKVTLKVTEAEKKLLDGVAARFPSKRGPKGPSMAQAVTHLVRHAFACLMFHHPQEEIEPKKISPRALQRFLEHNNASVVDRRSLQKPRICTIDKDGKRTWDDD